MQVYEFGLEIGDVIAITDLYIRQALYYKGDLWMGWMKSYVYFFFFQPLSFACRATFLPLVFNKYNLQPIEEEENKVKINL